MSEVKTIKTRRKEYYPQTTIGEVWIDGVFFCYCLEDTVRPRGIKVHGHTAIPEGVYKAIVTNSTRFDRETVLLYNSIDHSVSDGFCSWFGIRNHGGNTHKDTEGCPLTAYHRGEGSVIYGRSDLDILEIVQDWLNDGYVVEWEFINETQIN